MLAAVALSTVQHSWLLPCLACQRQDHLSLGYSSWFRDKRTIEAEKEMKKQQATGAVLTLCDRLTALYWLSDGLGNEEAEITVKKYQQLAGNWRNLNWAVLFSNFLSLVPDLWPSHSSPHYARVCLNAQNMQSNTQCAYNMQKMCKIRMFCCQHTQKMCKNMHKGCWIFALLHKRIVAYLRYHQIVESSRCCAGVSVPLARAGLDMNIFFVGTSKAEHSMRMSEQSRTFYANVRRPGLWPGAEAVTTLRCGESNQLKVMVTVKLGRGMVRVLGCGLRLATEAGHYPGP